MIPDYSPWGPPLPLEVAAVDRMHGLFESGYCTQPKMDGPGALCEYFLETLSWRADDWQDLRLRLRQRGLFAEYFIGILTVQHDRIATGEGPLCLEVTAASSWIRGSLKPENLCFTSLCSRESPACKAWNVSIERPPSIHAQAIEPFALRSNSFHARLFRRAWV